MDHYVIAVRAETDDRVTVYYHEKKFDLKEKGLLKTGLEEICDTLARSVSSSQQNIHEIMGIIDFYRRVSGPDMSIFLCDEDFIKSLLNDFRERNVWARVQSVNGLVVYEDYPEKAGYFELLKKTCQVKAVKGHGLVRIGAEHDGGYVMLDDLTDSRAAYSFGIADEISWDEGIADRGIDVYCYDHTIEGLPRRHDRLHFNKVGIAGEDRIAESVLSMETILRKNGHERERNLILKMDVEGAEWGFIAKTTSDILVQFSQMTFELHGLTIVGNGKKVMPALRKINKTHQAVWIHANNCGGVEWAGEMMMPRLLEITYVNRERYQFDPIQYHCPLEIDAPNIPDMPDIRMEGWGSLR